MSSSMSRLARNKRKQHDSDDDDEEAELFPDVPQKQVQQSQPMSGKKRLCKKSEKTEEHSDDDLMEEDEEQQGGETIQSSTPMIQLSQPLPGKKRLSKKRQETSQPDEHSDDDLLEEGEQEGVFQPDAEQSETTVTRQTILLPEKKRLAKQRKPETEQKQMAEEYSDDDNDLLEEEHEYETKTTHGITDKVDDSSSAPMSDHIIAINTMLDSDNVELLRNMMRVCKVVNKSPTDDTAKAMMTSRKGNIRTDGEVVDLLDMLLQAIEVGACRIVKELLLLSSSSNSSSSSSRPVDDAVRTTSAAAASGVHKAVTTSSSSSSSSSSLPSNMVTSTFRDEVILHSFNLRHQIDEMHEVDQKIATYTDVNRIVEYATKSARKMKRRSIPSILHTAIKHNQLDIVSWICDICPFYALVELWKREDVDEKGAGANVLFDLVDEVISIISTHPLNTPSQHILSMHLINILWQYCCQSNLSTHSIKILYHPNNPCYHRPLSTDTINSPSPPTLSMHPLNPPNYLPCQVQYPMLLKLLTSIDIAIEKRRNEQRKKQKNGSSKRYSDSEYESSYSSSSSSGGGWGGGGGGKDPTKFSSATMMELLAPLEGTSTTSSTEKAANSSCSIIDLTTTTTNKSSTTYNIHAPTGPGRTVSTGLTTVTSWHNYHFSPVRTQEVNALLLFMFNIN